MKCNSMQDLYAPLTRSVHLLPIYTYKYIYIYIYIYIYVYMSLARKWVWKRDNEIQNSGINVYLAWMPAGVQMDHGSPSVHVQWFSHQDCGADIHDIIK